MYLQTTRPTPFQSPDKDRFWLPGPPPARRETSIESVERWYRANGLPELHVPVRRVDLWSTENRTSLTLQPYFEELRRCDRSPTHSIQRHEPGKHMFLFHGCANDISPLLIQSFSRRGPSIRFSRPKSYFSREPAVYWTSSLDFAFAWCVFTETGHWLLSFSKSFECIICVSKVDLSSIHPPSGVYVITPPSNAEGEQRLVDASRLLNLCWIGK